MRKPVLFYGLIAGAIMALVLAITNPFPEKFGDNGELIGYTTMVLAFLLVYFGIRSYRDNVANGDIGFGRAFKVGALITLVAATCYVVAWEVTYHTVASDFVEKYAASAVAKARASGASDAQIEAKKAEMAEFAEMYRNPIVNVGLTLLEVLPVGLVVTLISAGILSRRKSAATGSA